MTASRKKITYLVAAVLLAALVWGIADRLYEQKRARSRRSVQPAPVQVAEIRTGPIELRRTFSGTLEAMAKFVVAPKVSGRVVRLWVDIADSVERGQMVAELDDDEYVQAVNQARADLAVARANLSKAEKALEIADRELSRVATLRGRGVSSESQYDEAKANQLSNQAQFQVAKAQLTRAEAALETANIRLSYTKITADWTGGDTKRVVAERYVDEGDTVAANAPLLSIVELDPITGVIFVAEKDYAYLKPGQGVELTTDAYPAERFQGRIDRIAPIFKESSRQARVELRIDNRRQRLKPGMFVRATVVLDRVEDAVIVPDEALVGRDDRVGLFLVDEKGPKALWREVKVGIRQGRWVQISGQGLSGRVITLGQQLVDDGSAITIPDDQAARTSGGAGPK
jgi:RND family efflux transporter MFP subunit